MTFLKRGEATQRILTNTYGQQTYKREPVEKLPDKPHPAACPKCGKNIGRGRFIHIKNCKG